MDVLIPNGILTVSPEYKPGDQAPRGFLDWQAWADVQHKAGLRQVECGRCGKWKFPQQISDEVDTCALIDRIGMFDEATSPVCTKCLSEEAMTETTINYVRIIQDGPQPYYWQEIKTERETWYEVRNPGSDYYARMQRQRDAETTIAALNAALARENP